MCMHNRSTAQVEWYLPDRRITPSDEHEIAAAARHLITHTSLRAGRELEFTDEARDMFDSYQVMIYAICEVPEVPRSGRRRGRRHDRCTAMTASLSV